MSTQALIKCYTILICLLFSNSVLSQSNSGFSVDLGTGFNYSDKDINAETGRIFSFLTDQPALAQSVSAVINFETYDAGIAIEMGKSIFTYGIDAPVYMNESIELFEGIQSNDTWAGLQLFWKPRVLNHQFILGGGYSFFYRAQRTTSIIHTVPSRNSIRTIESLSFFSPHVVFGFQNQNIKTMLRYNINKKERGLFDFSISNYFNIPIRKRIVENSILNQNPRGDIRLHVRMGFYLSPNVTYASSFTANAGLSYHFNDDYFVSYIWQSGSRNNLGINEPDRFEVSSFGVFPRSDKTGLGRIDAHTISLSKMLSSKMNLSAGVGVGMISNEKFDNGSFESIYFPGITAMAGYTFGVFSNHLQLTFPIERIPFFIGYSFGVDFRIFKIKDKEKPRSRRRT